MKYDLPGKCKTCFLKNEVKYWGFSQGSLIGSYLLYGNEKGIFKNFNKIILASGSYPGDAGSSNEFPYKEILREINENDAKILNISKWEQLKERMNLNFFFTNQEKENIKRNIETIKKIVFMHGGTDDSLQLKDYCIQKYPNACRGQYVDLQSGFPKLLKDLVSKNVEVQILIFHKLNHSLIEGKNTTIDELALFLNTLTDN